MAQEMIKQIENKSNAIYKEMNATYKDSKMSAREKVEKLAGLLLRYPAELRPDSHKEKSPVCREFESHILNQVMMLMSGLKTFSYEAREVESAGCASLNRLVDISENGKYSGEILNQSLKYALKAYGLKDQKTGKLVPFAQLFFAAYAKKRGNKVMEMADFKEKACLKSYQTEVKKYLALIADNNGVDLEDKLDGYLSAAMVENLLDLLNATDRQREYVEEMSSLLHHTSLTQVSKDDEGDEYDVNRKQLKLDWMAADICGQKLTDRLEASLEALESANSRTLRDDVVALATLRTLPVLQSLGAETILEMMEILDPNIISFVRNNQVEIPSNHRDDIAAIYAAYLGLKYNTARKRLNMAAEALANIGRSAA